MNERVKVAFFGGLDTLRRSLKMRVIQVRGSWKDYGNIHALASHGIDIPTALAAGRAIDRQFNPPISIWALQFYGDGSLSRVPLDLQRDLESRRVHSGKRSREAGGAVRW
jgi:hypothetical protein